MTPRSPRRVDQFSAFLTRCMICFLQSGSLKSYGVLVEDLTKQTRMSFAMAGLILPLQQSLSYFLAPIAAAMSNRIGIRATVILGGFLAGLGYIGNGILPLNSVFLATFCTCAGVGYGITQASSFLHLRNSFPNEASFGIIQTLADQFVYVGISVLPLVFEKFKETYGLQGALLLFGGLNLHIMIAGVIMTQRDPPRGSENNELWEKARDSSGDELEKSFDREGDDKTLETLKTNTLPEYATPDEETSANRSRDQSDVISSTESNKFKSYYCFLRRNKSLIFLIVSVLSVSFTSFGWILFLVPLGKEKGLLPSQAVLLSTAAGVGALFGRVWCIILYWRKVETPFCYFGLPALIQCAAFLCLSLTASTFYELMVISFISGVPFGVIGASVGGICAIKVSSSDFQKALVLVFVFVAFGTEAGGGICGTVYDHTSSGVYVFLVLATSNMFLVLVSAVWSLWERSNEKFLPK